MRDAANGVSGRASRPYITARVSVSVVRAEWWLGGSAFLFLTVPRHTGCRVHVASSLRASAFTRQRSPQTPNGRSIVTVKRVWSRWAVACFGVLFVAVLAGASCAADADGLTQLTAQQMSDVRGAAGCCDKPTASANASCRATSCTGAYYAGVCPDGSDAFSRQRIPYSDHRHCGWCLLHDNSPCPNHPYLWACAFMQYYYSDTCAPDTEQSWWDVNPTLSCQ